jgi:hypothetical protein
MDRMKSVLKWLKKNKDQVEWQRLLASEKSHLGALRCVRERRKRDPNFKLRCVMQSRLGFALKSKKASKQDSTMSLVGCSIEELWQHLEKQFKPGMTRENHGEWHVDHIKPCAKFNLLDPDEQRACFHYTNLQPLWAAENWKKNATFPT